MKIFKRNYFFKGQGFCRHSFPIVVNSIPKCGTNLILNIVNSIPRTNYTGDFSMAATYKNPNDRYYFILSKLKKLRKGDVYSGHVPYSDNFARWLNHNAVKQIFIYRNPRDYTVSLYHYVMKNKKKKHEYYELYKSFGDDYERLKKIIAGYGKGTRVYDISDKSVAGVGIVYNEFVGWLDNHETLSLKYEDIIGIKGNNKEILRFINKIFTFLELENKLSDNEKIKIFEKGTNPKKSHTFRSGKEGGWKEEYTDELVNLFNKNFASELLKKYNYFYDDVIPNV